jgi:two-component system chemotaxis family response regulator WspR
MSIGNLPPSGAVVLPASHEYPIMVLLVDDQAIVAEAIRRALLDEPIVSFHYCDQPTEAIALAKNVRPTVILQDLVMPGIDGLELVRRYRADPITSQIPIIVLSTKEEPTVKRDAFTAGANDYLVKLPDRVELVARVRYHSLAYVNQLQRDEAYRALRESQRRLMETNLELQRLTNVDGLTGLSNRKYFAEYMDAEWHRSVRTQTPLSVLMMDIDHFKQYNDSYGHIAGDEVLKRVAQTVKNGVKRSSDLVARFGGEEFIIVLSNTSFDDAHYVGDKLSEGVEALKLLHRASVVGEYVTVSVGGSTTIPKRGGSYVLLIDAADKALYEAKRMGRNRAVMMMPTGSSQCAEVFTTLRPT